MGRPRKTPLAEIEGLPQTPEEIEFEQFLEEIGPGTAVIHVLRMKPDGSRPQVGKTTMDQVREDPWEYLRSSFGPGKYMLLFRGSDRLMKGARVLEVEGPAVNHQSNNNSPLGNTENLSFQDKLLLYSMFKQPAPPPLDIGGMMAGLAAIMTAVKPTSENGTKPVDPLAMFQSILTMYQSLKPKEEKSELDRLRDTAAVIKEFSGDKDSVDGPWGVVASVGKDVVDKLGPVLAGFAGGPKVAATVGSPSPSRPAAVASQVVLPQTSTGAAAGPSPDDNIRQWVAHQLSILKLKGAAGKDPGFWVDYLFENQEEPGCQALLYAIKQGATFDHLLAFDPEIAQNPTLTIWFREVYEGVKSGLQSDVDSGGGSGDAGDTATNGSVSTPGLAPAGNSGASTKVS